MADLKQRQEKPDAVFCAKVGVRQKVRPLYGVAAMQPDLVEAACANLFDNAEKAADCGCLVILKRIGV